MTLSTQTESSQGKTRTAARAEALWDATTSWPDPRVAAEIERASSPVPDSALRVTRT
jgi:hypothetical protein